MQSAADIGVVIKLGIKNGRPDSGAGREMHDGIEFLPMKQGAHRSAVAKIDLVHRDFILNEPCLPINRRIVEIIEIVGDGNHVQAPSNFSTRCEPINPAPRQNFTRSEVNHEGDEVHEENYLKWNRRATDEYRFSQMLKKKETYQATEEAVFIKDGKNSSVLVRC